MKNTNSRYDRKHKIVCWIARFISTLAIAFFIFMCIGELMFNSEPWTLEGAIIGVFAIILMTGVLIAWWKEDIGGTILIVGAVAFAIFIYLTAGRNKILASVLISSPFFISGMLFLMTSIKSRQ